MENTYILLAKVDTTIRNDLVGQQDDSTSAFTIDPTENTGIETNNQSSVLSVSLIVVLFLLVLVLIYLYLRLNKLKTHYSNRLDGMRNKSLSLKKKVEDLKEAEKYLTQLNTRLLAIKELKPVRTVHNSETTVQDTKEQKGPTASQTDETKDSTPVFTKEIKYLFFEKLAQYP